MGLGNSPNRNKIKEFLHFLLFITEVEKTKCQREQEQILALGPRGPRPISQFIPQCDIYGNYLPTQCHPSTGYCWCVDRDGNEMDGTRSGPGIQPPCKLLLS